MAEKKHPQRLLIEDGGFHISNSILDKGYPCHWHDFYEFEWVISGSCIHHMNDNERLIKKGDLLFCTTTDIHTFEPTDESIVLCTVHFDSHHLTETSKRIINSLNNRVFSFDEKTVEILNDIFTFMAELEKSDFSNKKENIKNRIEAILLYCAEADGEGEKKKGGFLEAVGYIDNNFREPITLLKAAKLAGFSAGAFSGVFHEKMGVTFQEYLVTKRLKWAATMLKSTELNITQIAYDSGFNSHSHFSHTFKDKYGISPAAYRSKYSKIDEDNT